MNVIVFLCLLPFNAELEFNELSFKERIVFILSFYFNAMFSRLIAFNLGYLPGGDKTVITTSKTTLLALEAAERILMPGGLISMVVYIGHPGGR